MKTLLLSLLLVCGFVAHGAEQKKTVWLYNFEDAQAQAKKEGKHVLIYFTGSDWSQICINYKRDVLTGLDFTKYARRNLILVEADFPNKGAQSPALRKSNEALKEKFHVSGLPVIVVLNKEGVEVWRQNGAPEGGVRPLLAALTTAVGDKPNEK
ncbi:MAG: trxA [Verrucomicrobiales bacterium]|nr:trxA [Verrucomicrobiales bacterium]